jgi:pilus assembly protein Flp/PilA
VNLKVREGPEPPRAFNQTPLTHPIIGVIMNFLTDENGATAIEYGLIAALVSIIIIGGLTVLGGALDGAFSSIGTKVKTPG